MKSSFVVLGALLGLAPRAFAQSSDPPEIRVTGRARVTVSPDQASVDVGVVTEAPEAKDAARRNAEKLDAVLKSVRTALGADAKFETVSYSLNPLYRYPEPRREPVLTGYSATNVVRVKELALDRVGEVIDLATTSGANTVSNIAFGLRDEASAKARALREAAVDARSKADAIADALGVQIIGIFSATEGEPDIVRPMPMYRGAEAAMAQAPPPTPVEAGSIEVSASVTLAVWIRQ